MGGRLFADLLAEARSRRPEGDGVTHGQPGDVLSRLAVSRQLREAVSGAVGVLLVPTYEAVYQYHGPGSEVRPHRDKTGYPFVFHMTLAHEGVAAGSEGSVLEALGERTPLAPGECLVLRGGDTLHRWTALGSNEHRILIAVGFEPERKEATMPDDDNIERDDENEEQDEQRLPDLDVTDEAGQAIKGGIPTVIDGER